MPEARRIRYPSGVPLDDLDIGTRYDLELRVTPYELTGRFLQLILTKYQSPRLVFMPDGRSDAVTLFVHKIANIKVAGVE